MPSRILDNSTGWNPRPPKWTHSPGAVDTAEAERGDEKEAGQQQQQVAVALQVTRVPHDDQGHDVGADADGGPGRLDSGVRRVPSVDDDVADAVEQRGQREHPLRWHRGTSQRFAMWAASARPRTIAEERADVGRDLRVLAERRDDVERHDDARDPKRSRTNSVRRFGLGPNT